MTLTYQQARLYLAAAVAFSGGIVGLAIAYGQAQVQLQGGAALLLLIPMSAGTAITSIAYSVAARSVTPWNDLSFLVAWGLTTLWLMWGAAIPTALHRIRRGR